MKNNKKREAALKNEAGGTRKLKFEQACHTLYLIKQVKFLQLLADVDLLYFHRGQPQHRELHALLFSNNVWVL